MTTRASRDTKESTKVFVLLPDGRLLRFIKGTNDRNRCFFNSNGCNVDDHEEFVLRMCNMNSKENPGYWEVVEYDKRNT